MAEEENLRQSPPKAREKGTSYDEEEANSIEFCFAGNHHNDADSHGSDDGGELPGGLFKAEEECEQQHEGEGGRLTHRQEGEGDEAERGIAEADIERCCSAAGQEAGEVEEGRHERLRHRIGV